jgi:hypothetical protein
MAPKIKQWVGENPKRARSGNDPFDVQTVQKLLRAAAVKLSNDAIDPGTTGGVAQQMVNGVVVPLVADAIKAFQRDVLKVAKPDGRILPNDRTWKALVRTAGEVDTNPDGWPSLPSFRRLGPEARKAEFTTFEPHYISDPRPRDKEHIKITHPTWERDNIHRTIIPQLAKIRHPKPTKQPFHRKAIHQFQALWQAWEDAGLLHRILTYQGSFSTRFMRGTTKLSNHAWATAFDINAGPPEDYKKWNGLGRTPAVIWEEGSVFELVPLAHLFGFYWGGHFTGNRVDGMHFEVAVVLKANPLTGKKW